MTYQSGSIQMGCFIPGIQVYTDADEHASEREMVPAPYHQMLQAVVIQHTVIEPFAGSPFLIEVPILLRIPWDPWVETEVRMVFDIDRAPIIPWGAFPGIRAGTDATAF